MAVVTVVDRFYQMVHFIVFSKSPSAKETVKMLDNQVFRLYSLSSDIISDHGESFGQSSASF